MAAYTDLSAEDQAVLDSWLNQLRAWSGTQVKHADVGTVLNDSYNANVSAILATITTGTIPNAGGLGSGAAALTSTEVVNLVAALQGIDTNYNTDSHRQGFIKASGVEGAL